MILLFLFLVPAAAGCVSALARTRRAMETANLAAFAIVFALALAVAGQVLAAGPVFLWSGFLYADSFSALVAVLTASVALVCSVYAVGFLREDQRGEGEAAALPQFRKYYTLTPLFVSAMLLVVLANNLGVMWVAIEATTLASVFLVTFYGKITSLEAAWKYAIIGGVGLSMALFATVLAYYSAHNIPGSETLAGLNWSVLASQAGRLDPTTMRLAFILALLGYGAKAGLAPMHTWKPDAYSEAPVPAAALLGAAFINCAIYAIMRFDVLAEKCLGHQFPSRMLLGFGLFSILLAAPFVLVQRNFRRLLAYSSIDHAGIMVAALGFGGRLGFLGAVLHMLFHAVTKPLLFFCAGNVQQQFGSPFFRKVRGVIHTLPWTGGLFLLGAFAVTGTPPFSLFQSEFITLSAALAGGRSWTAVLFVLGVVTIFVGFLLHMSKMNLGAVQEAAPRAAECPWKFSAMALVAAVVVTFSLWLPAPLFELVKQSVHILGGAS